MTLLAESILNVVFAFLDFFSFTAWIFYGLAMLSLLVMRKTRAKEPRPFKVAGFTYG